MMSGADYLVQTLKLLGVEHWFIMPGELSQVIHAALIQHSIPFTVPRHETAAVFMADGYHRHTGRLAAVCNAGGASALNMMAGLSVPLCESTPLVAVTPTTSPTEWQAPWHDLFADAPSTGSLAAALGALTKGSFSVTHMAQLSWALERSVLLAQSGRRGPISVDIPLNVLTGKTDAAPRRRAVEVHERPAPSPAAIERVIGLLAHPKVAVMAGRGVLLSGACDELRALAERFSLPVLTTLSARTAFPDSHPLALGIQRLDAKRVLALAEDPPEVCLVLGASGWEWDHQLPLHQRHTVHVDIDASALNRFDAALGIAADCRSFLTALLAATEAPGAALKAALAERRGWAENLGRHPWPNVDQTAVESTAVPIAPQRAVYELAQALPAEAGLFIDIGEFLSLTIGAIAMDRPGSVVFPIRPSHMGWAIPAAMGAQLTDRQRPMLALVGDGGMLMSALELATAVEQQLPVVVMVMNNGGYNSIRRGFETRFPQAAHRSDTMMWSRVDFATVARGLGCDAARAERPGDVGRLLGEVLTRRDRSRPLVIDAVIEARPDPEPELSQLRKRDRAKSKSHG